MEKSKRSIAKAITWRFVATTITVLLVLIFTGELVLAGSVGAADVISKLIAYYIHERAWDRVDYGRP